MLKQTGLCFLVGALGVAACGGPSDNDYSGSPSAGQATSGSSGSKASGGSGGASAAGGSSGSSKGGSSAATGGSSLGGTTDAGGSSGTTGGTDVGGSAGTLGGSSGDTAMGGSSGDTAMGGTGMTSGGAGAMAGTGNETGGGSGMAGKPGVGGSAGAGPDCEELATMYAAALDAAKVCDPNSGKDQCTELVQSSLTCGCDQYVNPENAEAVTELTRLRKQGTKCMELCPAIACLPPEHGTCEQDSDGGKEDGHCLTATGILE